MTEKITISRHSDEIQEIITKVPSWIVRWGIVLFGVILLMILSISAVIRYPDTIKLPIKLQTTTKVNEVSGVLSITQEDFTKIKPGQEVLVSLIIYPAQQYGQLKGKVTGISDEPDQHGLFTVKVQLNISAMKHPVKIKNWMTGHAEIVTQDITVLQRITMGMTKI